MRPLTWPGSPSKSAVASISERDSSTENRTEYATGTQCSLLMDVCTWDVCRDPKNIDKGIKIIEYLD